MRAFIERDVLKMYLKCVYIALYTQHFLACSSIFCDKCNITSFLLKAIYTIYVRFIEIWANCVF